MPRTSDRDVAAAAERTALAWQRTALAVIAAGAILTRVTVDRLGPVATFSVAVAAPLGLWVCWLAVQHNPRRLAAKAPRRDGVAPLLLAVASCAVCAVGLAAVVTR